MNVIYHNNTNTNNVIDQSNTDQCRLLFAQFHQLRFDLCHMSRAKIIVGVLLAKQSVQRLIEIKIIKFFVTKSKQKLETHNTIHATVSRLRSTRDAPTVQQQLRRRLRALSQVATTLTIIVTL